MHRCTQAFARGTVSLSPALFSQKRTQSVLHREKSEIQMDWFDINLHKRAIVRQAQYPHVMGVFKTRRDNVEQQRGASWRRDEQDRRDEARIRALGKFHLPLLDYQMSDGVAPAMSGHQLQVLLERKHQSHVLKLNSLIKGTHYETLRLDEIIRASANDMASDVFTNASEHFNNCFFWKSIGPYAALSVPSELESALAEQYGSFDTACEALRSAVENSCGSSWVWLVWNSASGRDQDLSSVGRFEIISTIISESPLAKQALTPLLVVNACEDAWRIDYETDKNEYAKNIMSVLDWHWAERHWKQALGKPYQVPNLV